MSSAGSDISPDKRSAIHGFTLVEIMVVVALMGIIAALVGPRIGSGLRGAHTKTSVRRFAAALRAARTVTVTHRAMIVAVVELGENTCNFRVKQVDSHKSKGFSGEVQESKSGSSGKGSIPAFFSEPFELEGDVKFQDFKVSENGQSLNRAAVLFLPQGNSSGGVFTLGTDEGPFYEVSVDSITGRVHIGLRE